MSDSGVRTAVLLCCLASGCVAGDTTHRSAVHSANARQRTPLVPRYLALGDSYTIGEGVVADRRWPEQLVLSLHQQGIEIAAPQIIAETGWTTADLLRAMDRFAPQGPYALVTVMIGVNDQYQGVDLETYRVRLRAVLGRAIRLADCTPAHVVVVSIPDWSVTPFAGSRDRSRIAHQIESFNAIDHAEAESAGTAWVDVTPISQQAATNPRLLAADGLHPSGAMHAEWVELIAPAAARAMAAPAVGCELGD